MSGISFGSPFFAGSIEVVCGPMFSGKTEELIRRVRRAQIARQKFKFSNLRLMIGFMSRMLLVTQRNLLKLFLLRNSLDILKRVYDSTRVVAIDEIQFFDEMIIKVVTKLAEEDAVLFVLA